jgi:alpha-tubulin suppressor-like RCC1 family protein
MGWVDVYSWGYGDTGSLGHGIEEDKNGYMLQCSDDFCPCKLDVLKKN